MRTATHDHRLGDHTVHAGDQALVVLAAANCEPTAFDNPTNSTLAAQVQRRWPSVTERTTAWGAALARAETGIALEHTLAR